MSPELLDPTSFGLARCRLTKESDCYALGMVIYEILSGLVPFAPVKVPVLKILRGERPERPRGEQGVWFTDGIWETLELCWKPQPNDRPSLKAVLRCLGDDAGSSTFVGAGAEADADNWSDVTTANGSGTPPHFCIGILPDSQTLDRPHVLLTDLSIACRAKKPSMPPCSSISMAHI